MKKSSLRALFPFVRVYGWRYAFGVVVMSLGSLFTIGSAYLLGQFIASYLSSTATQNSLTYFLVGILGFEILALLSSYWGKKILATTASWSVLLVRKKLIEHMSELSMSYYDKVPQGRIVTRITHDVEGMEDFFSMGLGRLFNSILLTVISMLAMLVTYAPLGILCIVSIIPAFWATFRMRRKVHALSRMVSKTASSINARLNEFLNGLSVIRSYGLEKWSLDRYAKMVARNQVGLFQSNNFYSWERPLNSFLCNIPLLLVLGLGAYWVHANVLEMALYISFIRFTERFTRPLINLSREVHEIQNAIVSMERVSNFLLGETEEQVLRTSHSSSIQREETKSLKGHIEFKNVSMRYDQQAPLTLKNISFEVIPGEWIGLVGKTGSGKTSTISLLSRLYEFESGDILIDGVSLRDYNRSWLRSQLGVVTQDVSIFRASLMENIILQNITAINDVGERNRIKEKLNEAIKQTGLEYVMKKRHLTLDSEILDRGANLSVGERQLIALTRILFLDPKILILDEATSSIDPAFEEMIQNALKNVMANRTCLFIAHRLNTLKECHRLLVFLDGEIIEQGSFEELNQKKEYFHSLYVQSQNSQIHQ